MKRILNHCTQLFIFSLLISACSNRSSNTSSDEVEQQGYYEEQYRPQFHFSPEANWMNDPNGLVYLDGEYHLFYQYYPDSTVWGPMHWGHAVSLDLVHWQHLPAALFPDSLGYIFSGSAVIDKKNTSGLGSVMNPAMIAIFTYHNPILAESGTKTFQNQGIAYSLDKGRSWTKYSGNPVLKNPGISDFRDPKVFWYDGTGKWIMILAVHDRVHLYSSPDLLKWSFESEFGMDAGAHGGVWECPDLFRVKIEGSNNFKWVMLVSMNPGGPNGGSATQYFTGEFDGHKFVPEDKNVNWVDWGRDNYAGVTWSDIPDSDGRRLFLGWMSNWDYATVVPSKVWRSAMTLPRELSLIELNNKYLLTSIPVRETELLRGKSIIAFTDPQEISGERDIDSDSIDLMQSEMIFEFNMENSQCDTLGLILENSLKGKLVIGYSSDKKQFFVDRRNGGISGFSDKFASVSSAPYSAGKILGIHLFVDAASVELFADDGRLVMTNIVFPTEKYTRLKVFTTGGDISLERSEIYGLNRIWN
jgi:fructan beta-fructosidase